MACRWNHAGQRHLEGKAMMPESLPVCPVFSNTWGVQWSSQPRCSCSVIKMMAIRFPGSATPSAGQMFLVGFQASGSAHSSEQRQLDFVLEPKKEPLTMGMFKMWNVVQSVKPLPIWFKYLHSIFSLWQLTRLQCHFWVITCVLPHF